MTAATHRSDVEKLGNRADRVSVRCWPGIETKVMTSCTNCLREGVRQAVVPPWVRLRARPRWDKSVYFRAVAELLLLADIAAKLPVRYRPTYKKLA
ncbi:hypothetical protein SAMN04488498_12560 [Mesorhizobium albiziae]|uniref:Uncharacterized protein n=1 Tax=Neomesorhizobium albiziae TaxID=335020 RepID=A0A1I4EHT6_9HYPH|nr:hypothetical protein SAMN04488498_12560 [Mesorhizobium albiziae]